MTAMTLSIFACFALKNKKKWEPRWPCWRKIRDDPLIKVGAICPRPRSQQGQLPRKICIGQWDSVAVTHPAAPDMGIS